MHSDSLKNTESDFSSSWNASPLDIQLERAKEDLELIAYVMSHDLKSPLRTIASACDILNKPNMTADDGTGQQALKDITRESARMKALMEGLLDYLNLETFGPTRNVIDTMEVLSTVLIILEEKIQASGAKIMFDGLPEIYGHRGRYTRLFIYLIDNSIKFHGADIPHIVISAHTAADPDFVEFHIQDNGIGIKEEYSEIIFQLFQRLHSAQAYPGNGIGLALCKKIVESNGGKLWLDKNSGSGSCFCFTLPKTPAK